MPHISKYRPTPKTLHLLGKQLFQALAPRSRHKEQMAILELLTETEEIMLAKRCAVIALFERNVPSQTIAKILKMSRTTVVTMRGKHEAGEYKNLSTIFGSKKQNLHGKKAVKFVTKFIKIFPRYTGPRWEGLKEL